MDKESLDLLKKANDNFLKMSKIAEGEFHGHNKAKGFIKVLLIVLFIFFLVTIYLLFFADSTSVEGIAAGMAMVLMVIRHKYGIVSDIVCPHDDLPCNNPWCLYHEKCTMGPKK